MSGITAKQILTKTKNTDWFGTDYNMNVYRGCNHGCIYCDSRSECYQIEQFDQVTYKENALVLLNQELQGKRKKAVIGFGAMSDAYNQLEKKKYLTRQVLELIDIHGFGISLATKSSLLTRDIDCFKKIQRHSPVNLGFSFSTSHDGLARKIERNVSLPSERFRAIEECKLNGLYCGLLMMPILPYITDNWKLMADLIYKAHEVQADYIYPLFGMTLRDRQKDHYIASLHKLSPALAEKYQRNYKETYFFPAQNYERLVDNFKNLCTKLGIVYEMAEIISNYQMPYEAEQSTLF
ncbi:radical SAM protein [Enterococcus sp. BWT-B8]|uniref:SPL family radical SAM protein n=1 Tax=unclassified Enterococcus TaxID=2608891 RepID=UPI001E3747A3|nr:MULTISPECIES: radical SAM protein [unclassified Enterococcus]MCB5950658.1 radical SAM protein [Enterococcus sp. BWT-B8]MCB5955643.1 radical SAM protein [Enterococcus sp. CWB-B31]